MMDNARERKGAMTRGVPFGGIPLPSGTVDGADRRHLCFRYAGLSPDSEVAAKERGGLIINVGTLGQRGL